VQTVPAKTIVHNNKSPDSWFGLDFNMNIYRGCSHGCIYCDSRSNCFQVTDFDVVKMKENALQIIRDDLRRKTKTGVVGTGSMSDPYNPLERELNLTRNSLELMNAFGFGVSLITKSPLVTRDIDVLKDINTHSPVIVQFSITAADDKLCRKIEPNVSVASERFEALAMLAQNGIFCGVAINPTLPYITDSEDNIKKLLQMAKDAGAKFVYTFMSLTLRPGSREYYYDHLDKHFPGVREQYVKRYGNYKYCNTPNAKKLWSVFAAECERLGLLYDMKAITHAYKYSRPNTQMTLFD